MYGLKRAVFAIGLMLLSGCEPQMVDDPIPLTTFTDVVINLSLPEYSALRVDGGLKLFNNIGVRGVIVYRVNATTFHAYERNCSYHPNEAGSTVDIHTSNLFFQDFSCGSTFNLTEGQPTGGPAWRPLRQYHTDVTVNVLTITSDVIN
jgi:nitrite reductase/ring-hydroxylating ferredoxin subunit